MCNTTLCDNLGWQDSILLLNMFDLTRYICPQLFVQFKLILKKHQSSDNLVYKFAHDAQLNDVFRYLEQQKINYEWKENQLTVFNSSKEQV